MRNALGVAPKGLRWVGSLGLVTAVMTAAKVQRGTHAQQPADLYEINPIHSQIEFRVPFMGLAVLNRPQAGARPLAELVFAGLLAIAAIFVGINEGRDNWQSIWTCAMYLLFAFTLWLARAEQSPK